MIEQSIGIGYESVIRWRLISTATAQRTFGSSRDLRRKKYRGVPLGNKVDSHFLTVTGLIGSASLHKSNVGASMAGI